MQLISIVILLLSVALLVGALLFVAYWHRTRRNSHVLPLREGIGHIGISVLLEYPKTKAPLLALLDEEYPRCEALLVADLQRSDTFDDLVQRFHLVRVNHSHLFGVRTLYRSRHRAYRRVVVIDLPMEYRSDTISVARRVAAFDYMLHLTGESVVACGAIGYSASIIASQPLASDLELESVVGAPARLVRCDTSSHALRLHSARPLAWRKGQLAALFSLLLPAAVVALAVATNAKILLVAAVALSLSVGALMYLSCCVVAENSLFARLDAIIRNFYRYLVDKLKKNHYLYKERKSNEWVALSALVRRFGRNENNRESL